MELKIKGRKSRAAFTWIVYALCYTKPCDSLTIRTTYLHADVCSDGNDLTPFFPEQNETLQGVQLAGQPQRAALVHGDPRGGGEEDGGRVLLPLSSTTVQ